MSQPRVRVRRPRALATLLMLGALAACAESAAPTASSPDPTGQPPRLSIDDGANDGNEHFYFLPPMVPQPTFSGTSDGTLAPVVMVCEWNAASKKGCAQVVAQFARGAGSPAAEIVYDATAELYHVNWNTNECTTGACTLDPAKTYRLRVLVGAVELGHADLDVVSSGQELRNVETGEYIGLIDGRTLPVKFRIEQGAVKLAKRGEPTKMATKGGTILTEDRKVALKFPEGALAAETDITVTTVTEPMIGVGAWAEAVNLGPDGSTFAKPVTLTLGFDARKLPAGVPPSALAVVTWTGTGWRVVEGSSVNEVDNTVSAPISHFSIYSVFIIPNLVTGNAPGVLHVGQTTQLTGFVAAYEVLAVSYCHTVVDWNTGLVSMFCDTVPYAYMYYPEGLEIGWWPPAMYGATAGFTSRYSTVGPGGQLVSPPLAGLSEGPAYLQAEVWGTDGVQVVWFAHINVLWPVHSVTVSPSSVTLSPVAPGNTAQLTATVRNVNGEELFGRWVDWISADPGIASVDQNGLVTAHAVGKVEITAISGGEYGSAAVTVGSTSPEFVFTSADLSSGTCCIADIMVQRLDGSDARNLTDTPLRHEDVPRWSPDGSRIVFWRDDNVHVIDTSGTAIWSTTDGVSRQPSFSPDGKYIAFTQNYLVTIMDAEKTEYRKQLSTQPGGNPVWAPIAPTIAFEGGVGFGYELFLVDIGGETRQLTKLGGFNTNPSWSPDGKSIAFAHQRSIYVIDLAAIGTDPITDVSKLRRLTFTGTDYAPSWSLDGSQIIFASERFGQFEILIMNADGSDVRNLTNTPGRAESIPSIRPKSPPIK